MTATLPRWLCEKATLEQLMAALRRLLCEKAVFRFAAKLFQICCSACASCFYFLQNQLLMPLLPAFFSFEQKSFLIIW